MEAVIFTNDNMKRLPMKPFFVYNKPIKTENTPENIMKKFEIIYKGQRVEVEADTMWLAKQKGAEHFKVASKNIIWCVPVKVV